MERSAPSSSTCEGRPRALHVEKNLLGASAPISLTAEVVPPIVACFETRAGPNGRGAVSASSPLFHHPVAASPEGREDGMKLSDVRFSLGSFEDRIVAVPSAGVNESVIDQFQ